MQVLEKDGYRIETCRAEGDIPMRICIVVSDDRLESLERATLTYHRMQAAYAFMKADVEMALFEYGIVKS